MYSGAQVGSRSGRNFLINLLNFFSGLKALQGPLESRLEPLMLVLRAPKTRKVWLYFCKITFFAHAAFWYFEALEDILGPRLALLSPF